PSDGTIGDMAANASNGKLVKNATLQFTRPKSSRIIPMSGPTDVIPGRKLNETKIIPIIRIAMYNRLLSFCSCSNCCVTYEPSPSSMIYRPNITYPSRLEKRSTYCFQRFLFVLTKKILFAYG